MKALLSNCETFTGLPICGAAPESIDDSETADISVADDSVDDLIDEPVDVSEDADVEDLLEAADLLEVEE